MPVCLEKQDHTKGKLAIFKAVKNTNEKMYLNTSHFLVMTILTVNKM